MRFLSPTIYLFNNVFILMWTYEHLFYTWSYNPIPLGFIAQIVPALARGSSLVGSRFY